MLYHETHHHNLGFVLFTISFLCWFIRSTDIFDYTYIDAFGKGKQLTVKECEYLIGHHVTEEFYGVVTSKEVLQRMVGNLLNLGKRWVEDHLACKESVCVFDTEWAL